MHFDFEAYAGTPFFWECLNIFDSTFTNTIRIILVGYTLMLIYYLIRGTWKERTFFVFAPIILMVLVLNPWAAWQYVDKLSLHNRFFRFFWLLPVAILYMYFFINVVLKKFGKKKQLAVGIVLGLGMVAAVWNLTNVTNCLYTGNDSNTGMLMVDNRYKVQDDVLIAADIIAADKQDAGEEVRVLYDYFTYIEIRTYDASVIPVLQGNDIHTWRNIGVIQEQIDTAIAEGDWLDLINMMFSGIVVDAKGYLDVDTQILRTALQETNTEYVILPDNNGCYNQWLEAGVVIGYTPNYTVLRIEDNTAAENEEYKQALYVPTSVTKIDDIYFIMDSWQHRLLYSFDLDTPVSEWSVMTEEITGGHTVASNGNVYVTEDTEGGRLLVFQKEGEDFQKVQTVDGIEGRPHYTIYDDTLERFLTLSSDGGVIHVFREQNGQLELEETWQFQELQGSYIRSMSVIDGYLYLTCGPGYVTKIDYLKESVEIVDTYPVTPELYNMNYIAKINDYFYCTINVTGEDQHSDIIRTKNLESLEEGRYESLYQSMEFEGTPYFISCFDDKYYVTEVGENGNNGIRSFEVTSDDKIQDVEKIFFFQEVSESSRMRKAERM